MFIMTKKNNHNNHRKLKTKNNSIVSAIKLNVESNRVTQMNNCLTFSSIYSSSGCHFWLQSSPFWRTLWRSSWQIVCWFSQCCQICSSLMYIFLRMLLRRSSGNISAFSIRKTHNNTNTNQTTDGGCDSLPSETRWRNSPSVGNGYNSGS